MFRFRALHTNSFLLGRFPALPTKISRNQFKKNQQKIQALKEKLGDKYRLIGRDKRQSPITERRSPTKDSQPKKVERPVKILPYLFGENGCLDMDQKPKEVVAEEKKSKSRLDEFVTEQKVETQTILDINESALSPIISKDGIESKTEKGPYYQHGVLPSEIEFVLKKTPLVTQDVYEENATQQPELIRRILSMDTANSETIKRFNIQRVIEIFRRHATDTGSSEVQAAVMTIKILDMKKHLEQHKKDKSTKRQLEAWTSKRRSILKYLKRQDLKKAVFVCEQLGVDPLLV